MSLKMFRVRVSVVLVNQTYHFTFGRTVVACSFDLFLRHFCLHWILTIVRRWMDRQLQLCVEVLLLQYFSFLLHHLHWRYLSAVYTSHFDSGIGNNINSDTEYLRSSSPPLSPRFALERSTMAVFAVLGMWNAELWSPQVWSFAIIYDVFDWELYKIHFVVLIAKKRTSTCFLFHRVFVLLVRVRLNVAIVTETKWFSARRKWKRRKAKTWEIVVQLTICSMWRLGSNYMIIIFLHFLFRRLFLLIQMSSFSGLSLMAIDETENHLFIPNNCA